MLKGGMQNGGFMKSKGWRARKEGICPNGTGIGRLIPDETTHHTTTR